MKNTIYVKKDCKNFTLSSAQTAILKKAINAALEYEKVSFPCEISVSYVDDMKIKELNRDFRNIDKKTDVLSFPLYEREDILEFGKADENIALGDIIISYETALSQSDLYGHSFEREICFLAVHSVLHLLGYDHEQSEQDEKYMNDTCEEVLEGIGLGIEDNSASLPEEDEIKKEDMRTGFVSIIGRPNVGKSTLLNAILGEKVAIVSKKPQTTRTRITGVHTVGCDQFVFVDTPGIHKPHNKLGEYMVKAADSSIADMDAIIFVVEPTETPTKIELDIAAKIKSSKIPAILVINKIDAFKSDKQLVTIDNFSKLCNFDAIIPISALNNDGTDIVLSELSKHLKAEKWYFPKDMITDQPERQIVAEVIREKLLRLLDDEIPHGIAVVIEQFSEKSKIIEVRAEIYCEKEAHKKIIIGKAGATLKKAASYAREDLEAFFGKQIYLNTWVKVKENWRDSVLNMNRLGFTDK